MIIKIAETKHPIHELIAKRWSPRAFDITKLVTREQILTICEAARWSPSCSNDQPWRFMVWDKNHNREAYIKAFNCLGEWNQKWVKTAPVLLASIASFKFNFKDEINRWTQYDTGAASENICLQATSMGLMAHQMGGYDADKLKKDFNIPEEYTPMAMIAIGYQTEDAVLEDIHRSTEGNPRIRKPLSFNFFDSEWEKPIFIE
jgi:nitroreductase